MGLPNNHGNRRCHPVVYADDKNPMGSLSPSEFYKRHFVSHSSSSFVNSRGLRIFTQSWTPLPPAKPIGVVCMVHGFTGESSSFIQLTAVYFAKAGFTTCALDLQGHGFSDGLAAHIPDIHPVVEDCATFFDSFCSNHQPSFPRFLYAESLGGAIALLVHLRAVTKRAWDGLVLNGAMCGISNKIKPPWPLEHLLGFFASVIPTWPVVPTRGNVVELSFKVDWKRRLAVSSPCRYMGWPRTATAHEMLRVCQELQGRFEEVSVPLLIVHGGDDVVCDPECAEELYRRASSKDKTIKIYPGMWHQLVGEPDDGVEVVFGDILDWLLGRARKADDDVAPPPPSSEEDLLLPMAKSEQMSEYVITKVPIAADLS